LSKCSSAYIAKIAENIEIVKLIQTLSFSSVLNFGEKNLFRLSRNCMLSGSGTPCSYTLQCSKRDKIQKIPILAETVTGSDNPFTKFFCNESTMVYLHLLVSSSGYAIVKIVRSVYIV